MSPPQKSTDGSLVCTDKNASPVNGICKCNSGYAYTDYGCETVQVYCSNMGKIYNSVYGCVPITSTNNAAGPGYTKELNRSNASLANGLSQLAALLGNNTGHNCLSGFGWKSYNNGSGLGACQADPKTYSFQKIAALSQLSGIQINISTLRSNYYYLCSTNFCSDPNKLIH